MQIEWTEDDLAYIHRLVANKVLSRREAEVGMALLKLAHLALGHKGLVNLSDLETKMVSESILGSVPTYVEYFDEGRVFPIVLSVRGRIVRVAIDPKNHSWPPTEQLDESQE